MHSQDQDPKLEKDLDPEISEMQDIMRNIKKKKNDLYDKTTIEFVDVSCFSFCIEIVLIVNFFLSFLTCILLSHVRYGMLVYKICIDFCGFFAHHSMSYFLQLSCPS